MPFAIAVGSQTGANSSPPGEGPSGGPLSCGGSTGASGAGAGAAAWASWGACGAAAAIPGCWAGAAPPCATRGRPAGPAWGALG